MVVKKLSLLAVIVLSGCAVFEPFEPFEPFEDMSVLEEEDRFTEFAQNLEDRLDLNTQTQDTDSAQNIDGASPLASSISFKSQQRQRFKLQNDQQQAKSDNKALVAQLKSIIEEDKQSRVNSPTVSFKQHDINHYVRGLMQDLVANLQYVNSTTPVAVVTFVMLDSNYNDSNLLGRQIAESLIHEVHKFGIPVIDFKTTGYIRVTEQGDFAFSKDYEDFTDEMAARYIVGGTMLKQKDGYLVNARIVGVTSKVVVASAQRFIPTVVANDIMNIKEEDNPIINIKAEDNAIIGNQIIQPKPLTNVILVQG